MFTKLKLYLEDVLKLWSVHGIRYVLEKRSREEKVVWTLTMSIIFIVTIFAVLYLIKEYEKEEYTLVKDSRSGSIYDIPFPAITICPYAKINTSILNIDNIISKAKNSSLTPEESEYYEYLRLIIPNPNWPASEFNDRLEQSKIFDFLEKVSTNIFQDTKCIVNEEEQLCSSIFKPIILDGGYCFVFNVISPKKLLKTKKYPWHNAHIAVNDFNINLNQYKLQHDSVYPHRPLYYTRMYPVQIDLVTFDEDLLDSSVYQGKRGYRAMMHNPTVLPTMHLDYFDIPLDTISQIKLLPTVIKSTAMLDDHYSFKSKPCFLPSNEKSLQFFKYYRRESCEQECIKLSMEELCGCSAFYFPMDSKTTICNSNKNLDCTYRAVRRSTSNIIQNGTITKSRCNCLANCNDIIYYSSQRHFYWDAIKYFERQNISTPKNAHFTRIQMFYINKNYRTLTRIKLISSYDLYINCLSVFGMFFGMSIISLVEILYFIIRFFCNFRLFGKHWLSDGEKKPRLSWSHQVVHMFTDYLTETESNDSIKSKTTVKKPFN